MDTFPSADVSCLVFFPFLKKTIKKEKFFVILFYDCNFFPLLNSLENFFLAGICHLLIVFCILSSNSFDEILDNMKYCIFEQ